ncbi:MAG: FHA domain-containing serine/threonine-protein kinase [Planctomycetales bacterium]
MPLTEVIDQFLQTLSRSHLLSEERFREVSSYVQNSGMTTAQELCSDLVRQGDLTRFQVDRLLEGRHRGYRIGHYQLQEVLGAGGMGWLYLARDLETEREVALKVLADRHKHDPAMRARFQLEARAGKELSHPNIVKTYELNHQEDLYGAVDYVVMEFIQGINLQERVDRQGRLDWQQACDVGMQAAAALGDAHKQGMVHRDIKPANLIISQDGQTKILDFGLALIDRNIKREEDRDEFSLAMIFGQDCLGTDDYIAPEQSRDSQHVDGRADIYSLGCTMYFLMSGKVPFPLKSVREKLEAHREQPPPDIRTLVPEIPENVALILKKMMSKKPTERFASMQEVVRVLTPLAVRKPVEFQWEAVLNRRAKEARLRLAGQRAQKAQSQSSTGSAARSESSVARIQLANLETAVGQDTQQTPRTSSSGIELDRPFQPYAEELTKLAAAHPIRTGTIPAVRVPNGYLIPSGHGQCIPLSKDCIIIGRHPHCDVQVLAPQVSSQHCELRREGKLWRVTDLNSTNGIRVNGKAVTTTLLNSGDRLAVSPEHEFQITYEGRRAKSSFRHVIWVFLLVGAVVAGALWWQFGRGPSANSPATPTSPATPQPAGQ